MSNITYTFAADSGKYADISMNLLESIIKNTDASQKDIVIYVIDEGIREIPDQYIEYMHNSATVIEGPMPNPGYRISAAQGALVGASKKSKNDYIILLDADTVVLDDVTVHKKSDADLFLCPEFIGTRYWSNIDRSYEAWRQLYNNHNIDFPPRLMRSLIDNKIMLPYYNGGVIITKNNGFPSRLLKLSNGLFGRLPESNYFTEMVALALLASDYSVSHLDERHNFFQPLYMYPPPDDTVIVHYNDITSYYSMLRNAEIRNRLKDTTITKRLLNRNRITHFYKRIVTSYLRYARVTDPKRPPYRSLKQWTNAFKKLFR